MYIPSSFLIPVHWSSNSFHFLTLSNTRFLTHFLQGHEIRYELVLLGKVSITGLFLFYYDTDQNDINSMLVIINLVYYAQMRLVVYLIVLLPLVCFCKKPKIKGATIDSSIVSEAELRFDSTNFGFLQSDVLMYRNLVVGDFYESDTLKTITENDSLLYEFFSYYYHQNDTTTIEGLFGIGVSFGFSIKIHDSKIVSIHFLNTCLDEALFALDSTANLQARLEVPASYYSLILNKIPSSNHNDIVYGYLELESKEFYVRQKLGGDPKQRAREKTSLKLYFKANYVEP